MGKIAIIGLHDLYRMQFLYKYTDILDSERIDYDVICWNRRTEKELVTKGFKGRKYEFSYEMDNQKSKISKIPGYIKSLCYANKIISRNKYDKYILLTTQTSLPMYLFNRKVRTGRFVFDYRDITFENNPICKMLIKRIIENSVFTAMSSTGFTEVTGRSSKITLSHNEKNITHEYIYRNNDKENVICFTYGGGTAEGICKKNM